MKRWPMAAAGMLLAASIAVAQPVAPSNTGYLVIRVKLSPTDGVAAPGGVKPPGGIPGGFAPPGGILPGGFAPPGGQPGGTAPATDERSVFAVIPIKSVTKGAVYAGKTVNLQTNPRHVWANHEYGKTLLFDDGTNVQVFSIPGTIEQEVKKLHTAWAKDRTLDGLLDIIAYALSVDHVDLAVTYANEFEKQFDASKSEKPRLVAFAKAYAEIKGKLEENLPAADAEGWRKRLKASAVAEDKHYALIHWGEQSVSAETINKRLTQLERNFKAFYLWHAIRGTALPFPDKRLVVVLANRPSDIDDLRPKLDGLPVVSDGFYSPAHNIVVLSPTRLDEAGKTFAEIAKAKYQDGWNREELLKGKAPIVKSGDFSELYRTMTYALVDRALEEEATHAAITREANRQLYSTLGILPQHVILPKWIDQGVSNLLHKPKDAGLVKLAGGKNGMAAGLMAGYGSANYVLLREWRDLWAKKELSAPPKDILTNVLTDRYFDAIRTGIDPDPAPVASAPGGNGGFAPPAGFAPMAPGGPPGKPNPDAQAPPPGGFPKPPGGGFPMGPGGFPMGPGGQPGFPGGQPGFPGGNPGGTIDSGPDKAAIKAKIELKSQVTSWALIHYLTKTSGPALNKFYADLDKLPRDMRLDSKVVVDLFALNFNLMNTDRSAIDEPAYKSFAENWITFMNEVPASWYPLPLRATSGENLGNGGTPAPGVPGPGGFGPGGQR